MNPQAEIAKVALENMFAKQYFDICALDGLGDMMGVNVQQHHKYPELRALHCVHYNKMSPQLKAYVRNTVLEILSMESILYMAPPAREPINLTPPTPERKNWLQKLLT